MLLNLSYNVCLNNNQLIIKSGTYNNDNCGGPCDWCISTGPLEGALISLPYNGEKYFYVFSFYTEICEGDLLTYAVNNVKTKWIKIEEMHDYVYLCNEKINEKYEEFADGVIYFAIL